MVVYLSFLLAALVVYIIATTYIVEIRKKLILVAAVSVSGILVTLLFYILYQNKISLLLGIIGFLALGLVNYSRDHTSEANPILNIFINVVAWVIILCGYGLLLI